ncbi:MAG: DNA polymerase III subunit delta [Chthonomonadaceae bacterium]|nr:DNA polymerase III subunit delta [Chthonomonadaceae bacterium]
MKDPIETAAQSRLVILIGDDALERSKARTKLIGASGSSPEETETYLADASDPKDWFATASVCPFFGDRRTVVVRNVGRVTPSKLSDETLDKSHKLVQDMKSVPESGLVVLVGDDEGGDDDRQRRLQSTLKEWATLVKHAGGTVLKFDSDPKETVIRIRQLAAELGKTITPGAASLLCDMVLAKPTAAASELEKVALYVGDVTKITEQDVKAVVSADHEYNVYRLSESIFSGDAKSAVAQLRWLFARAGKLEDQMFSRVFPTILSQFRLVWQARYCLDQGVSPSNLSPELRRWLPEKQIGSEPEWKQNKATSAARKTSVASLDQCMKALVQADAESKGQLPALNAQDTLERMTLTLCAVFSSSR